MSVSVNYLSSSLRFRTASPVIFADKENGDPAGLMTISFSDANGQNVMPAQAVTTIVQFKILRPTSIYRVTLLTDDGPNGLFFWQIGRTEYVSNFDLSFLSLNKKHEFILPDRTYIESIGASDQDKTMRFIIRNHAIGEQLKYQITLDSVEYA